MTRPAASIPVADHAPQGTSLTSYDRAHAPTYLRLLDAAAEGAPWEKACLIILGIDPAREPERAAEAHRSHLERAEWFTREGYREWLRDDN
jgi:hypothetical protein